MRERGSRDVLLMTLTEAVVLLFFILAMAFAWQVHRYRNLPSGGLSVWDSYVAGGGTLPDDWTTVLACVEKSVGDLGEESCAEALKTVRRRASVLASKLGIDTAGIATEALLDSVADEIEEAKEMARDAVRDFGMDGGMVDSIPLAELVNVLRGRGSAPPCWWQFVEGDREIIFVLEVVLRSQEITIERIWPESYDSEARQVSNLVELSEAGTITYDEFRRLALPVLRWGQTQNPQCRHFVIIHDSVVGGDEKADFKKALLTVEDYFYKYLVN